MPHPRIRGALTAGVAITVVGLLAGCGAANGAAGAGSSSSASAGSLGTKADPVTITFWDDNGGPARTPLYQHIISDFQAANPTIKVDYVGVPAGDAVTKYQTAVSGGSAPDIGIIEGTLTASLVGQGALAPLDSLLKGSSLNGKIASDSLQAARATAPDNKLYLLPMTSTPDTIWYRGDMIKKAGLTPPTTWNDFYKDVKALNDSSHGVYGFGLRGGAGSVNQLVPVAYSCSGLTSFWTSKSRTKTTLSDPKVGKCLQQFADIYGVDTSKADIGNGYQQMVTEFDTGKAAMIQHNLGSATNHVAAFGAGVAIGQPMPVSSISKKLTLVSPTPGGPVVFSASKHQAAAWKFAQYLLSESVNSYWNKSVGQIPGNLAARSQSWVKANQPIKDAVSALGSSQTVTISSPLYLPDWASILNDMATDWQSVLSKKMTGQQFADAWAAKVDTAQADFAKHSK